jgi:hypothetical protein
MRSLIVLSFVTSVACQTGCAAMIDRTGADLTLITSRADAVEMFGPPLSSVQDESTRVEEFKTRRKIADPLLSSAYGMEFGMLGILEPENTAAELIGMTRNAIIGQNIRFTFDESGNEISYEIDDLSWKFRNLYPIRRLVLCSWPDDRERRLIPSTDESTLP